jgi:hypothetical protein
VSQTTLNKVDFRGSITATGPRFRASYEIENMLDEDIFILDVMFRLDDGSPVVDSSLFYTIIEGGLLTAFRGVIQIPEGMQVEVPDLPFARLLPAGKSLGGIIDAPLPLRFNQPYDWNDQVELRTTREVRLRIGYVIARDIDSAPPAFKLSDIEAYRLRYRDVIGVQCILETRAQSGVVDILVQP